MRSYLKPRIEANLAILCIKERNMHFSFTNCKNDNKNLSCQGIFGKQKFYRATLATLVSDIQQKVVFFYVKDISCSFIEFLKHYADVCFLIAETVYILFQGGFFY